MGGDAAAKERLREGLSFIHKSIEVNPQAHFGREIWQAVAVEFMLAVVEEPELLLQYDMIGNHLQEAVNPVERRSLREPDNYAFGGAHVFAADVVNRPGAGLESEKMKIRDEYITRVGTGSGWQEAVATSHQEPVPFDEPALGIIGMWRLGGGANPHFALALGEIMIRVGQRYIAWCAYERAALMADRFWPDRDIQQKFLEHCRRRQEVIEARLAEQDVVQLRSRFEAELKYGQRYQQEYQEYEARRIAEGASIDEADFYDDFLAGREPIASPSGEADKFVAMHDFPTAINWPAVFLFAGLFAFAGAVGMRLVGALVTRRPEGGR
jgi:hypothetical protein